MTTESSIPAEMARVALVTGASRGLGAAIAHELASDGFIVVINHRSSPDAAEAVAASIENNGGVARVIAADITDANEVRNLVETIENGLGSLHAVVFNATGPQPPANVDNTSWGDVLEQLNYFVKSPMLLLDAVLPGMKLRNAGRLVHVGSEVVDVVPTGSSAYVCAKTAQLGLARTWAKELGVFGVTVNTVAPGWVPVERHRSEPQEVLDAYEQTVPIGRMGVPNDVAKAVAFLCSDAAAFMTGIKLNVNGGKTLD